MSELVAIRIRTKVKAPTATEDTLRMLRLKGKNQAMVLPDTPSIRGMLEKASHAITWGELNQEGKDALAKRGPGPEYRLAPPRKGFERKGVKVSYNQGGAYGYRGNDVNELIKRMA
ncbi:uL30 family ribosomal protein [Candidatus Woesearchaeota archaeon]|nr:uL30 family ribosomal protein [Candidatus Woesearchaeota archaeon]